MTGQSVAHYQILEKLGEGGMGVVYKARDTRLDRFVALKFLPEVTEERKARFVQEARAASALNHPNIITIHDIGESEGRHYIAMEYVAGKTLDALIPRKGMRLGEALKVAVQVADALARAHAAGIIHRDLKPSNVMVDEHGLVKVLDFGLAKLAEARERPEETPTQTAEGAIVGTVGYMSPEQAEGKPVDARSDIFSFGSLLYEMVTGERPFRGDSNMSILAAIINQEPVPLSAGTPHDLEKVISRCLRKDPSRRFQHMDDVKIALEELKEESDSGKLGIPSAAGHAQPWRARHAWPLRIAGLAAVLVVASVSWYYLRRAPEPAMTAAPLTTYGGGEYFPTFSPDGRQVAFSWNGEKQDNHDIYVQLLGSGRPLRLTSDPATEWNPSWSPDGRHIAFLRHLSQGKWGVLLVPPLGGPERKVAEVAAFSFWRSGVAWSPDSRWLVTSDRDVPDKPVALFLVSVESGGKRRLTVPSGSSDGGDVGASFSPDGRTLAFSRFTNLTAGDTYLLALNGDLTPRGDPVRLTSENRSTSRPAWTADGREVIYSSGSGLASQSLWRIAAVGQAKPRRLDFAGEGLLSPAISAAGRLMAYARLLHDANIWAIESAGAGPPRNFLSSTRNDVNPQYSPDGKKIAYDSARSGSGEVWVCDADGSNAVQLTAFGGPPAGTPRWSPDGQQVVFDHLAGGARDISVVSASGGKPRALVTHPAQDRVPSWSRDGRWIYFSSNRGGNDQIWKVPAGGGEPAQVTRDGGYVAFESWDGKSLYYTKSAVRSPLFTLPLAGGTERQVLESVYQRAFAVTERGIWFISEPDGRGSAHLQFLDLATGKTKPITALDRPLGIGLAVSPDGRRVLYSQYDLAGSDLMLVENFR